MTVDEAARILRGMYDAGAQGRGLMVTAIHLFGIRYADDLSRLQPIKEILLHAGMSDTYQTEVYKGIRLAGYVKVVNDFP